jgi:hypothetical protein
MKRRKRSSSASRAVKSRARDEAEDRRVGPELPELRPRHTFPSHSFEQYYQAVRRCWRFGQKKPVRVDIVTTDGERGVMENLQRKAKQADRMFESLVAEMNRAIEIGRTQEFTQAQEVPAWLLATR